MMRDGEGLGSIAEIVPQLIWGKAASTAFRASGSNFSTSRRPRFGCSKHDVPCNLQMYRAIANLARVAKHLMALQLGFQGQELFAHVHLSPAFFF